ncbi:MAG: family 16 glycoside hydrolase [Candidatus Altiarchaeota archaeon]
MGSEKPSLILVRGEKVKYITLNPKLIILSAVILIMIFGLAAALYTLLSGGEDGGPTPSTITPTTLTTNMHTETTQIAQETETTQPARETQTTQAVEDTVETQTTTTMGDAATGTTGTLQTTTTLEDISWLPRINKVYKIGRERCSGWYENPCGNPEHIGDYNGSVLECSYADALPKDTRIVEARITLSQLIGTTGKSSIRISLNGNSMGNISGNANCDSDGPKTLVLKNPQYTPGGVNTISLKNLAPGGWVTVGDEEGPSTVLFTVNLTVINEELAASMTTTTSTTTSTTLSPGVVLEENFNDEIANGFVVGEGRWGIKNGQYTLLEKPQWKAYSVRPAKWSNYSVEADVQMVTSGNGGIIFRAKDLSNYYACLIVSDDDKLLLVRFDDGKNTKLVEANQDYTIGETFTIKAEVFGPEINCYYDGRLKIGWRDDKHPEGGVGVYSYQSITNFDNIMVRGNITTTTSTTIMTTTTLKATTTTMQELETTTTTHATTVTTTTATATTQASATTIGTSTTVKSTTTTVKATTTTASTTTIPSGVFKYTRNPSFSSSAEYWRFGLWDRDSNDAKLTGRWMVSGGNPGGLIEINAGRDRSKGVGAYWVQEFRTEKQARKAECIFDWRIPVFEEAPKSLVAYVFLDGEDGEPVNGTQIWSSGELTGTTEWAKVTVDCTGKLQDKGLHYLKLAIWQDTGGIYRKPYAVQYDNSLVKWTE